MAWFACRPLDLIWRTTHAFRGPTGSSTEGLNGMVRMPLPLHFGTPLTRFVAPEGAPPKVPAA
eukprot:7865255-Pyramimonas_sp.AAC.1